MVAMVVQRAAYTSETHEPTCPPSGKSPQNPLYERQSAARGRNPREAPDRDSSLNPFQELACGLSWKLLAGIQICEGQPTAGFPLA